MAEKGQSALHADWQKRASLHCKLTVAENGQSALQVDCGKLTVAEKGQSALQVDCGKLTVAEKGQSALQADWQKMASLHYKLTGRKGPGCTTS